MSLFYSDIENFPSLFCVCEDELAVKHFSFSPLILTLFGSHVCTCVCVCVWLVSGTN